MNGETALLWPKRMRPPTSAIMATTGSSHHAFRCQRKDPISRIIDLFPIMYHPFYWGVKDGCHLLDALGIPVAVHDIAGLLASSF